jgi:GNAT superfamily N-acetyltransferase
VTDPTIRTLRPDDKDRALDVINEAARWYREFVPPGAYHDPEMSPADFDREAARLTWYGAFVAGRLVGVMGLEYARDAALMRHAYILPEYQRSGLGLTLLAQAERDVRGVDRVIIGTYRENYKARGALEKAGYQLSPDSESILRTYYAIPEDRLQSSVTYEKSIPRAR